MTCAIETVLPEPDSPLTTTACARAAAGACGDGSAGRRERGATERGAAGAWGGGL